MDDTRPKARLTEVFGAFLKLGLTAFGGPVAHLGYFRDEFVTRRKWLDDQGYADLVALCQFLPGPASSQAGFALGLMRAGWAGALVAFAAFTLPSALLLAGFALTAERVDGPFGTGVLHGLKLVAVAIVAHAVLGMARNLCPDRERATIAVLAVALLALLPGAVGMALAIVAGAAAGLVLGRGKPVQDRHVPHFPVSRRAGLLALALFALLLVILPLLGQLNPGLQLAGIFFRAGSLVFGGGHVVLPLLETGMVGTGRIAEDAFLAGYGAAQAVPGPLFTFAAYLGMGADVAPNGPYGAIIALIALFLPGFLILIAALPFWSAILRDGRAQSAMQGANAAVVGVLAMALYSPVFTGSVAGPGDFALALAGFVALTAWKAPPLAVVAVTALADGLMGLAAG